MDIYNFENDNKHIDELTLLLENLSAKEAESAIQAIKKRKIEDMAMKQINYEKWFDESTLPILMDFAELTASTLKIEKTENSYIVATIMNKHGFDITNSCKLMKYTLVFSNCIGINVCDNSVALTLVFKYDTL